MTYRVFFLWAGLFACGAEETRDPVDPGPKPGPEWDHCPAPIQTTENENWKGLLDVTNGAHYCQRPRQYQDMERALTLSKQLRLVAGSYRLPTSKNNNAVDLPFCFRDATGPLESTVPGLASAGSKLFNMEGDSWFVDGAQNRGTTSERLKWLALGPPDDTYVLIDGTEAYSQDLILSYCDDEACTPDEMSVFSPCALQTTTCDRFTMSDGDALSLDQYVWVGAVGGGYAHITSARGTLAGVPFDISNYEQLVMTYGHHAFSRSAMMFFDEPIESACGLYVDEVTQKSNIWTVDCDGNVLDQLSVTEEVHEDQDGACP